MSQTISKKRAFLGRALVLCAAAFLSASHVSAADFYISATGKGKAASKEEPAKDLGNIITLLKPVDTVHIAEGIYTGRGDNGSDLIGVPVTIIGGYSADFSTRDPWGKHRTVLSGDNKSKSYDPGPRLAIDCQKFKEKGEFAISVDGVIVDNAARNRYGGVDQGKIERKASPSAGENATSERGGIRVVAPASPLATCSVTVKNCVVTNCAPTQGAISAWGYAKSVVTVSNNLIVNVTGNGIDCMSNFHPKDGKDVPAFTVSNNSILYVWKYDAFGEIGGNGVQLDADTVVKLTNNAIACVDVSSINNIKKVANVTLKDNLIVIAGKCEYLEGNTAVAFKDLADTPQQLSRESGGNVNTAFIAPVPAKWAERFATRTMIDRSKVESGVKPDDSRANALRSILGLPLQAPAVKADSDIWLHRLDLDGAIASGASKFLEKYGSAKP